jgi:hypothetical protein
MQDARANHSATLLADGRVLVAGGVGTDGHALASRNLRRRVNPDAVAPLSRARGQTATLLADGRVLIAGGDDSARRLTRWKCSTPSSPVSSHRSPVRLSSPRTGHAAALLGDGRVLSDGGFNGARRARLHGRLRRGGGDAVSLARRSAPALARRRRRCSTAPCS